MSMLATCGSQDGFPLPACAGRGFARMTKEARWPLETPRYAFGATARFVRQLSIAASTSALPRAPSAKLG